MSHPPYHKSGIGRMANVCDAGMLAARTAMVKQRDFLDRDRVRRHTHRGVQQKIDGRTRNNILHFAGRPREVIDDRIRQLESEWDMERVLETNASILAFTGAILGLSVHRRFFLVPAVVLGFLTQHATTGWCPPVPVFRRLGIRTRTEINQERYALKAIRGDFEALEQSDRASAVEQAIRSAAS
jgi:hypothetical protein